MKRTGFLRIGIIVSAFIHIFLAASIFEVSKIDITDDDYQKSRFVIVQIEKHEPPPPPPLPPLPKKVEIKKKPPVSHIKKEVEETEEVKPVFGVTKKTVDEKPTEGIGVRVGNTLMKEMEEEYTPPDQVKDYSAGSKLEEREKNTGPVFAPVPNTELAIMPRAINPAKPKYPEKLEEEEIEGEVILELSISREGKVVNIKVIDSDHKLFTEAALAAAKNYRFTPGKTKDGTPVDAVIEFTITFEMPL
ncbi:MAG TPA: TonB family protein [bacterium]|nr:TonB family protein [bacterium]